MNSWSIGGVCLPFWASARTTQEKEAMRTYIKCGYEITISEKWCEKTLLGEDDTIERRPMPLDLTRTCASKEQILKAVEDFFTEEARS